MSSDRLDLEIDAPWGQYTIKSMLDFIKHARDQLKYFLEQGSPNPDFTKAEIAGYEDVIATEDENVAKAFIRLKGENRERGVTLTNKEVVEELKKRGKWVIKN